MKTVSLIVLIFVSFILRSQDKAKALDKYFTKRFADGEFANVLFAENGKIIYQKSFGFTNDSTKTSLNDSSIFNLASISKQFTAIAIAILKDRGQLQFTDNITKYIPELPFKDITIKHLLYHTSGIPEFELSVSKTWDNSKVATNQDEIVWLSRDKPSLEFQPGEKFKYSNVGYDLLASIVERISKQKFSDFMNENIFKPLEMKHTSVYHRRLASKQIENFAWDYGYDSKSKKKVRLDYYKEYDFLYWMDGIVGSNNVHSTTIDMLKWDQALYTEKLVSKATLEEVFTPGKLNNGKNTEYGMGFFISGKGNNLSEIYGKRVYHGGRWGGYGCWMERNVTQNRTVIMLQNFTMDNHKYIGEACQILYEKK